MSDTVREWLDRTQAITERATAGPWEEDGSLIGPRPGASVAQVWGVRWKADGAFIAHARTALPAATAALRAVLDKADEWTPPDPCWDDDRPQDEWCTDCRMLNDIRNAITDAIGGQPMTAADIRALCDTPRPGTP